jgi:pyruvate dehydrogenase E2 component (dihydrolipoamide acetyltransferase)
MEIRVPNLGDGIDSAVIISILVNPGDTVVKDQTLFELETDKAVAPMPCPANGVIKSLSVKEGDSVSQGALVGILISSNQNEEKNSSELKSQLMELPFVEPVVVHTQVPVLAETNSLPTQGYFNETPVTTASLKKLAFRIGLDLRRIKGSESGGRIGEQDIINHVHYLQTLIDQAKDSYSVPVVQAVTDVAKKKVSLPDFSKWGEIEVEKLSSLRKKIAEKMTDTWNTVPAVTQNLDVNITGLMKLRERVNPLYLEKGAKLTLTVFAIKAVQRALVKFPNFNASYNSETNELIKKNYYHIGIAVDTENGLIVPVIKDVDKKSYFELCQELIQISSKAKERTLSVEDLQGSTFTISNLGGLGVGAFTPIINSPEVAILGLSSGVNRAELAEKNGKKKLVFRNQMPLSLSYDHRVIDGADAARFIMEIKQGFETITEADLLGGIA